MKTKDYNGWKISASAVKAIQEGAIATEVQYRPKQINVDTINLEECEVPTLVVLKNRSNNSSEDFREFNPKFQVTDLRFLEFEDKGKDTV